jgi:hypothetical protein
MDLENELRQAMAEHVTEMSAPRTLASEAKRRHHRTVRRRASFAIGAAGVIAAISMIPAYQSIHSQTVGADGSGGKKQGQQATNSLSATPSPTMGDRSGSPSNGPKGSHSPAKPKHSSDLQGPDLGIAKSLLGYLPQGLTPSKPCGTKNAGSKQTTTCRWNGPGGWVEVRLIRSSGLKSPADLNLAPPLAKHDTVHGHPALRSDGGPALASQVMWIERKGLGVWVEVSPTLGSSLTHVADGVNVT